MQADSRSGITDYVSTTAQLRAQQSIHDKEQRKLAEQLETAVSLFENKIIETVEDTYWVKEQYQTIITQPVSYTHLSGKKPWGDHSGRLHHYPAGH